jgi:predicted dehydrogenase
MSDAPAHKIRWGVLGYARIARESVMPAILRAENSELHALASRDASKLAEARTRFPALAKTCVGYEELLRDPAVDAVYIPLPNSQHREWTTRAAEHGKHVLCEKPLGLSAAEVGEMMEACAANGVALMEAFMYRYTDRTQQVRAVLRSGVLGEIKFVHASFRFPLTNPASIKLQPELGGGALYDVGVYPVNFAGLVADEFAGGAGASRPDDVTAVCVHDGGVDVMTSALLRYPSGMIASLHCGFNAQKRIVAEIVGTRGRLEIADPFFDPPGALVLTCGEERREIPVAASDRYRAEVEDFSAAILEKRAPQLGLAESLRNAEVLDRIFAAMRDS